MGGCHVSEHVEAWALFRNSGIGGKASSLRSPRVVPSSKLRTVPGGGTRKLSPPRMIDMTFMRRWQCISFFDGEPRFLSSMKAVTS